MAPGRAQLLGDPGQINALLRQGRITPREVPDPHWAADGCVACHRQTPTAGKLNLRADTGESLCGTCHDAISAHSYIHPTGMAPTKEMRARMPADFRKALTREDGRLSCLGCHDLPMTCRSERRGERALNPMFFRGGPYRERTTLCYHCHDARDYARLNPHQQRRPDGSLDENACRVCHANVPPRGTTATVDFITKGDLTRLCTGCHPWVPHPGGGMTFSRTPGSSHLALPSRLIARKLTAARDRGMHWPLEPETGRVYCGTCHNVHARDVLTGPAAVGAETPKRLRAERMCEHCHDK